MSLLLACLFSFFFISSSFVLHSLGLLFDSFIFFSIVFIFSLNLLSEFFLFFFVVFFLLHRILLFFFFFFSHILSLHAHKSGDIHQQAKYSQPVDCSCRTFGTFVHTIISIAWISMKLGTNIQSKKWTNRRKRKKSIYILRRISLRWPCRADLRMKKTKQREKKKQPNQQHSVRLITALSCDVHPFCPTVICYAAHRSFEIRFVLYDTHTHTHSHISPLASLLCTYIFRCWPLYTTHISNSDSLLYVRRSVFFCCCVFCFVCAFERVSVRALLLGAHFSSCSSLIILIAIHFEICVVFIFIFLCVDVRMLCCYCSGCFINLLFFFGHFILFIRAMLWLRRELTLWLWCAVCTHKISWTKNFISYRWKQRKREEEEAETRSRTRKKGI